MTPRSSASARRSARPRSSARRSSASPASPSRSARKDSRSPRGADPLAFRADQITDAEAKITADGQARAAAGRLDGDVKGTECSPYPRTAARRALEADPQTQRARYDCVAYTSKFEAPEKAGEERTGLFGFPYWLVIDYPTGDLVWCKVTPRAGEGGSSLASVPVPEPCREPAATAD